MRQDESKPINKVEKDHSLARLKIDRFSGLDNNRIAFLNDFLRYDFESYNDEEKVIFSNMDLDGLDTFYIDFDKLPNSLQEKSKEATGVSDLSDTDIMVIHRDLGSTAYWAVESRNLEEDPITALEEALNYEDKCYANLKN